MSERAEALTLDEATEAALGGELLSNLDPLQALESLARTVSPAAALRAGVNVARRAPWIWAGAEDDDPLPPRDRRFQDPTWQGNPYFRRLAGTYLLMAEQLMAMVENDAVDWRTQERSRLLMTVITTALAPTNFLTSNPAALKTAFETGGGSLVKGARRLATDLVTNRGLPSQVNRGAFVVGRDLAATPGTVIARTEMFELVQYTPTTKTVRVVPLVLLPPPVNKYYFWDLAPKRSLIEFAVQSGLTVFTIVWRDPKPGNGTWGVDHYLRAALAAVDIARAVAQSETVHIFGDCSGGMMVCLLLSDRAVSAPDLFRSATLGVTVVDFGEPGGIGVTASDRSLRSARRRAANGDIISAESIGDTFVWMRPDDLVWRYVVDGWLMGHEPPAFDVLFWNNDGQGLPSQFALDMTAYSLANSLIEPGAATALGQPVDLSKVTTDTYVLAGLTDHISPWKGCFAAAQRLGGRNEFVLTPTGHVQSIIYPPGNPKASFYTGTDARLDPDSWLAAATKHDGSWWPHWIDWLTTRSGGRRRAPAEAGNETYRPLMAAPGSYVHGG